MVKKSEFVWNTIGSFISSVLNAILLLFCTRMNGTEIAGMFSISFATAIILNAIGDFGIRIYQVTDTNRKYKFQDYLVSRIVVVFVMTIIGLGFVIISGYTIEKLIICMLLILFKVVDNISETYQAEFQINGRLDIGGKSIVLRNTMAILMFFIIDAIFKNIILACISLLLTNILFFVLYDLKRIKEFVSYKLEFHKNAIKNIIKECFPLGISTLLSMYITNAVKYAIDANNNYEMQTYFNILYLPTFTINLISLFVIKPILKPLGDDWNKKDYKHFIKTLASIAAIILVGTIGVEIICATIALPILSKIYGVDLNMYKIELLILILSGFFYAMATLVFYALSTIRKQKQTMIAYALTCIFSLTVPKILVQNYGMLGTAFANLSITVLLFSLLTILFVFYYKKFVGTKNK